ncbi:hypothetical protein GF325_06905 [Candidatus Bathyarchaeota archaeon]|nr:hypothetical protein [Candidatus Bathyarchaeota archaeon]
MNAQNHLKVLGFGIFSVSKLEGKCVVETVHERGVGHSLVQNVCQSCQSEFQEKVQGNTIIPSDNITVIANYYRDGDRVILVLFLADKDNELQFSKLYMIAKRLFMKVRNGSSNETIKEYCEKTLETPKFTNIDGVFILDSAGIPYFTRVNKGSQRDNTEDKEIHISGFISALFSFSQEVMDEDASLKEINFGNQTLHVINKHGILFAFLVKKANPLTERYLYLVADEFILENREKIKTFKGDVAEFNSFNEIIDKYFEI